MRTIQSPASVVPARPRRLALTRDIRDKLSGTREIMSTLRLKSTSFQEQSHARRLPSGGNPAWAQEYNELPAPPYGRGH